jgi:FMN phosphatase YigB (HAD superfamily)
MYPDITNAVLQDRKIFEEALRRASDSGTMLSANQCLYVGDSIKCDVQGAMPVRIQNSRPPPTPKNSTF